MSVTYLADMADALVDAGLAGLAEATTGRPAPTGYVVHSPVVGDNCCVGGQLTVHLENVSLLPLVDEIASNLMPLPGNCCAGIWKATFVVTLLRCVTNLQTSGHPATNETQNEDAQNLLADLWALLTQLDDQIEADTLWPPSEFPGIRCQDVTLGVAEPMDIEGNCAGWKIPVTVRLNDSGPTGS